MGYTILIGNAIPEFSKEDFPELIASWEVEQVMLADAPAFPNDYNNHKNVRWPSYCAWDYFCIKTGLYDFFYGKSIYNSGNETIIGRDGLFTLSNHPGCIQICKEDADFVSKKLEEYKKIATLPPGFDEEDFPPDDKVEIYDGQLARLIWLEWWMQWAVKNCETPAISNS